MTKLDTNLARENDSSKLDISSLFTKFNHVNMDFFEKFNTPDEKALTGYGRQANVIHNFD